MSGADELIRRVEALGAPYGFERSAKFVDGALLDERCLISLHRRSLGDDPAHSTRLMIEALGAPESVREAVAQSAEGAEVVHFGHEAEDGAAMRKVYFEYVSRARAAMAQGKPVLVHLAYKWRTDAGAAALARYVWRPCASLDEVRARIAARLPESRAPRARSAALRLAGMAAALARRGALHMLDVEEPGSPRVSLDMNVYDADLTVAGAGALIAETGAAFGAPTARVRDVFAPARDKALGHLAAGLDRRGREFVTFYFGVEARGR